MIVARGRRHLHEQIVEARIAAQTALLPPAVARFQIRARRLARRSADYLSLTSATRPADLRTLLRLARGRLRVVELGTATGWTAISVALAEKRRRVITYDVVERAEPERYLRLVDPTVRERVELVIAPGAQGPASPAPVELLYIDSSHEREQTVAEVLAWKPVLTSGALIVFDDYLHPEFPGIAEAIDDLGLHGEQHGTLFVHRVP
jgi:predicted O-methyltransferase YrrM